MTKLLVGYDGSDNARRALERAANTVEDGQTLAAIIVVPLVVNGSPSTAAGPPPQGPDQHGGDIAEAVAFLVGRGAAPIIIRAADDPADAICATADRDGYTTIVVGRRNGSNGKGLRLGSVSASVVRRAACDVLVVS